MYSTFKGTAEDTIEIITNGGVIGQRFQAWSHAIEIDDDAKGYFFVKKTSSPQIRNGEFYRLVGHDGFIKAGFPSTNLDASFQIMTDTIVEFGFDKILFEEPNFLSFDVLIKTNINGLEFGEGELYSKYPSNVFGTNVVANNSIAVSKGDVVTAAEFSLSVIDEDTTTFMAAVAGGCEGTTSLLFSSLPLSTEYQGFLRVQMEIQDFIAAGSLSLDDVRMLGNIYFLDPVTKKCRPFHDVLVPNPIDVENVCMITSFMDTVVTGGTGDVLNIIGVGFEAAGGQVEFPNADDGGATFMHTLAGDIIKWSDTLVVTKVPSSQNTTTKPAGTGIFRIRTAGNMLCPSPDTLDVCYSIFNFRSGSTGKPVRVYLADFKGEGAMFFHADSTLGNNADARTSIEEALCAWNRVTGIAWDLGANMTNPSPNADSTNMIFLADSVIFDSPNATMTTIIDGIESCTTLPPNARTFSYVTDIDIAVRKNLTQMGNPVNGGWNWRHNQNPANNQMDFYSALLHELGHAHLLKHSIPESNLMWWQLNAGDTSRTISNKEVMGGEFVLSSGIDSLLQGINCPDTLGRNFTLCPTTGTKELNEIGVIEIFPNPTDEDYINVKLDFIEAQHTIIEVVDVVGRRFNVKDLGVIPMGSTTTQLELIGLQPGIYIIVVNTGGNIVNHKIIKH